MNQKNAYNTACLGVDSFLAEKTINVLKSSNDDSEISVNLNEIHQSMKLSKNQYVDVNKFTTSQQPKLTTKTFKADVIDKSNNSGHLGKEFKKLMSSFTLDIAALKREPVKSFPISVKSPSSTPNCNTSSVANITTHCTKANALADSNSITKIKQPMFPQSKITAITSIPSTKNLPADICNNSTSVFQSLVKVDNTLQTPYSMLEPSSESCSKLVLPSVVKINPASSESLLTTRKLKFEPCSDFDISNASSLPAELSGFTESSETFIPSASKSQYSTSKNDSIDNLCRLNINQKSQSNLLDFEGCSFKSINYDLFDGKDNTSLSVEKLQSQHQQMIAKALYFMKIQKLNFEKELDHLKKKICENQQKIYDYSTILEQEHLNSNLPTTLLLRESFSDVNNSNDENRNFKNSFSTESKTKFDEVEELHAKLDCLLSASRSLSQEIEDLHKIVEKKTKQLENSNRNLCLMKKSENVLQSYNEQKTEKRNQLNITIEEMKTTLIKNSDSYTSNIQAIGCYFSNILADMESSLLCHSAEEICLPAFNKERELVTSRIDLANYFKTWTDTVDYLQTLSKIEAMASDTKSNNKFSKLVAQFYCEYYKKHSDILSNFTESHNSGYIDQQYEILKHISSNPCDYTKRLNNICNTAITMLDKHLGSAIDSETVLSIFIQRQAKEKLEIERKTSEYIARLTNELQELKVNEAQEANKNSELIYKSSSRYQKDMKK